MKKYFKILLTLLIVPLVFTACSKDDDPADNDLFVGTYRGNITYTGEKNVTAPEGKVTVIKVGNNYKFAFSDGIPDLNGVEFKKDANEAVSIDSDAAKLIKITAKTLVIGYTKDGKIWTANCSR
jgi:hypothetical protein